MLDATFNNIADSAAPGDRQKARNLLAAIRTLKQLDGRPATEDDKTRLRLFPGFGCLALSIFPDPVTGRFKNSFWEEQGRDLATLLTPEEYASARRTTFNAFYTSPLIMQTIFSCLHRFGVPAGAHILEPGCGIGNFLGAAPPGFRFTGIEQDEISGRIARALHPDHDIRIENFRDTRLDRVDAVAGNVPFADITLDHAAGRLSLHDYFIAKSLDILTPGGILAVVTSRFTLDKINSAARDHLAVRSDFLGAIRLPGQAFQRPGNRCRHRSAFSPETCGRRFIRSQRRVG